MRLLGVGVACVLALPVAAADARTTTHQSLAISNLSVKSKAAGGIVRGSMSFSPAGFPVKVVIKRGGRIVGSKTVTSSSGTTKWAVRLSKSARSALKSKGKLYIAVDVSASAGGSNVGNGTTATIRR